MKFARLFSSAAASVSANLTSTDASPLKNNQDENLQSPVSLEFGLYLKLKCTDCAVISSLIIVDNNLQCTMQ